MKNKHYMFLLSLIVILSFFLNFYAISNYGTGNEYYASAILSMTKSFKNFFFVAFDPAGMVSIDKPPFGFWIQAIFVLIFGYHGWVLFLPQALSGTLSCILIYILVSKYFKNRNAALVSSLIFAITPIVVAVCRNNTIDMQLIFVLLLSTLFLFKSLEKNKWRYLFIAAIFICIGFNIKMFQAYMVVPAFALTYLVFSKEKISKRFIAGGITIGIMLIVPLSWTAIVELYPASERPYIDSTSNNSVIQLIFGHNGLERLVGRGNGMIGVSNSPNNPQDMKDKPKEDIKTVDKSDDNSNKNPQNRNVQGPGEQGNHGVSNPNGGKGGQGDDYIGDPSPIRLWISSIYGQISWLIIFAICSIIVSIKKIKIKNATLKDSFFYFWVLWLLTMLIFFSFAGFYHRYYLCMIAPAISVLCGIGIINMYKEFKEKNSWKQYILPIALGITMILEFLHVFQYDNILKVLIPAMIIFSLLAAIFIVSNFINNKAFHAFLASGFVIIAILIAPFYWSLTPVFYVTNTTKPAAGPEIIESKEKLAIASPSNIKDNKNSGLENYLVNNYKEGSFLVVACRSNDVAKFIIDTGLPCYAYGGFLGQDNSLSLDKLKEYVNEGKITYFLISEMGGMSGNSEIINYVKENATFIDPSEYEFDNNKNEGIDKMHGNSLYCFK